MPTLAVWAPEMMKATVAGFLAPKFRPRDGLKENLVGPVVNVQPSDNRNEDGFLGYGDEND